MTAGADAKVPLAWTKTRGAGVVVAVIDTPVDVSHPDLASALWSNPNEACNAASDADGDGLVGDCHGWDFVNGNATGQLQPGTNQYLRHGSHVAGIIAAATGNGVGVAGAAPDAKIMPLNVAMSNGGIPVSAAAAAINYAVDHHASVINASWGGPGTMPTVLQSAIDHAEAAGVVMAIAAGNNGANLDTSPQFPANATNSNVITVGATTAADQPASFSNFSSSRVDVFAPGYYVLSTLPNNSYGMMSGTSMAAPYVAAEAALIRSANPSLTAAQVRDRVISTADALPSLAGKALSGGRIDVAAAMGVTPGSSPGRVASYNFNDFNNLDDLHPQQPVVQVQAPADAVPAGHGAALTFTFATRTAANQVMVITHFPFALTLPNGQVVTATTDSSGTATVAGVDPVALAANASFQLTTSLPAGLYAINAQLVDTTVGVPVGSPGRTVFEVGVAPGTSTSTTPAATSTTTAPGTTPTTAPGGVTPTTAPGGVTPTTAPGGVTPTTAPGGVTPTTAPGSTTTPTSARGPGATSPTSAPGTAPSTGPAAPSTTSATPPTTTAAPARRARRPPRRPCRRLRPGR